MGKEEGGGDCFVWRNVAGRWGLPGVRPTHPPTCWRYRNTFSAGVVLVRSWVDVWLTDTSVR
jgi:hypothetical protein